MILKATEQFMFLSCDLAQPVAWRVKGLLLKINFCASNIRLMSLKPSQATFSLDSVKKMETSAQSVTFKKNNPISNIFEVI